MQISDYFPENSLSFSPVFPENLSSLFNLLIYIKVVVETIGVGTDVGTVPRIAINAGAVGFLAAQKLRLYPLSPCQSRPSDNSLLCLQ